MRPKINHADNLSRDDCPVVASFGGQDITLKGAAGKLEAALTRVGVEYDVKEYPGPGTRS